MTLSRFVPAIVRLIALLAVVALLLVGEALSHDATTPLDQKAMTVLQAMSDYLAKEKTVSF